MRALHHNVGYVQAIPPAAYADDFESPAIDLAGYSSADIVLSVGAGALSKANRVEFRLFHSDDGEAFEPVTAEHGAVGAGGTVKALKSAHAEPSVSSLAYRGGKRFLKIKAVFAGTHAEPLPIAAIVVRSRAWLRPET